MTVVIQEGEQYLSSFLFALKTTETKRQYSRNLKLFFDFGFDSNLTLNEQASLFVQKAKDSNWIMNYFIQFFKFQIENRVNENIITSATMKNYFKAAKLFCVMNDISINWIKITKGFPKVKYYSDDRAPTIEEIQKLLEYPDRRIKPIVYTMISSGIRIGAWDWLKWKDVKPITQNGNVIAAKIIVYSGDPEQYYSFLTLEAYNALDEWMEYRASCGENVTGESWVIRDIWQTSERSYGASFGVAKDPQRLNHTGVKSIIERAIHAQGLWKPLGNGKKRREWQGAHGFRKFFKTQAEQIMKTINVEFCMGHRSDMLQKAYYKPIEKDVFEDYIKASELLTINEENRLRKKVTQLEQKQDEITLMKLKHETEMKELRDQMTQLQQSDKEIFECLKRPDKLMRMAQEEQ
jgi:hypothetical protein